MVQLLRRSTDAVNPSAISAINATNAATIMTIIEESIAEPKKLQAKSVNPNVAIALTTVT